MAIVFVSYSHMDEQHKDELEKHLAVLKRKGLISVWHDRRIVPGSEFDPEIGEHLEEADIILLLASSDFLASDYCYTIEMKRAMERHELEEARVVPVILRPCAWHKAPFGKLQAVPKDGKPITKYPNIDEAYLEVEQAVERILNEMGASSDSLSAAASIEEAHPANAGSLRLPRSSNLRVKRTFSDLESDQFREKAFEYISNSFEGSLSEMKSRNEQVGTAFRRLDANTFTATVYLNGEEASRCAVSLGDRSGFMRGVTYGRDPDGGFNEELSVENDGYVQYLKPLMRRATCSDEGEKLTMQGAAEYYWSMLVDMLQ